MSETPLTTMLSRVRDQYNSDVRWQYVPVILLLLIHLLTVGPFIELSREKRETEQKIERLAKVKSKIDSLGFKDLSTSVSAKLDSQLNKFVNNLISDFGRLDFAVQDLRDKAGLESTLISEDVKSMIPPDIRELHESILEASKLLEDLKSKREKTEAESGLSKEDRETLERKLNAPEFRESVKFAMIAEHGFSAIQRSAGSPVQNISGGFTEEERPFRITDSNLLKEIKVAGTRTELLEALESFVETNIIEPRYGQLNEYWKSNLLPDIQRQCDELEMDADTVDVKRLGIDTEWDEVAGAFEVIRLGAGTLEFKPPAETRFWWSSQQDKIDVRIEMENKVANQLKEPAVLKSLRDHVSQLLIDEETLGQKIDYDLLKLDEQFQNQADKLASIAKPLRFLALDLESVVITFPLLIGLVLAGAAAWTTLRLRELGWTIHLMVKEGADPLLWDWYSAQVFLLLPRSSSTMNDRRNVSLIRKSVGLCAVSWIWIGIALWRLCGIGDTSPVRLGIITCIGAAVAVLAQVHHYAVINSILSLKPRQITSPPTSSSA